MNRFNAFTYFCVSGFSARSILSRGLFFKYQIVCIYVIIFLIILKICIIAILENILQMRKIVRLVSHQG